MSEYKKGDRVKVTIEGVYDGTPGDNDHWLRLPTGGVALFDGRNVASIEKLADPLPTTPGSVIRHKFLGHYRMLDKDGYWFGRTPGGFENSPGVPNMIASNYEVIYDAGKTS